jgi:CheY-like chemotaxis protein
VNCILIADDYPAIRACLRTVLNQRQPDWRVCEAENGRDAITKAEQLHPDVIILDMSMPVMDGLEAARELKRVMPSVPLILWTSFVGPQVEREAKAAGFDGVHSKSEGGPILVHSILRLLQAAA